jgi:hypothetical protein
VAPLLWVEFLIGMSYLLAVYLLFRWLEFQAKRRDTLEAM